MTEDTEAPPKRWRPWLIGTGIALALLGLGVFLAAPADPPASPRRVAVLGFGEVSYRVERGDHVEKGCALLAENEDQYARGLMRQRKLYGYDGMVFKFPDGNTTIGFYMKDTPMPLSIAWFDGQGRFVSSADMEPNREEPLYYAAAPYEYAFEVPRGRLSSLGIGPGSGLVLGPHNC